MILITGASGFVGSHALAHFDGVALENVDLRNKDQIDNFIDSHSPNQVLHLAAQSFVPESIDNPRDTFDINFYGTFNLLTALKKSGFAGKFVYVSSGDIYGLVSPQNLPILETTQPKPRNPYAVSKVAAEALCYQWSQTENFEIIIARPFNHIGIGQNERFVIPSFAKQLAEIKLNLTAPIMTVGDIGVSRDFSSIEDILQAYQALFHKGINGETYNIASGTSQTIESLLYKMISILGIDVTIEQEKERFRKNEQREVIASIRKIKAHTGWAPQTNLDTSLERILNHWMDILA